MCWVSIIIGVFSLIYACFRLFFVSWTSNSRFLVKCIASWSNIFESIFNVVLLISININTIFLLFGTLLLTVWNGCWHWIQIGCAYISGCKVCSTTDCCGNRIRSLWELLWSLWKKVPSYNYFWRTLLLRPF